MKLVLALAAAALCTPQAEDRAQHLKEYLADTNLVGTWVYDDLEAGYAEAKKTDKPLLVVLRCVP
jgi:hypothetical protein